MPGKGEDAGRNTRSLLRRNTVSENRLNDARWKQDEYQSSHSVVELPNDPKLSDRGVRRGTCMVGGKAAVIAGEARHDVRLGRRRLRGDPTPSPWAVK